MKIHAVREKSDSEVSPRPSKLVNLRQMLLNSKGNSRFTKLLLFGGGSCSSSTVEVSWLSCFPAEASSIRSSLTIVLLVTEVPMVLGAEEDANALLESLVLALSVDDPAVEGGATSIS